MDTIQTSETTMDGFRHHAAIMGLPLNRPLTVKRLLALCVVVIAGLLWANGASAIISTQSVTTHAPASANSGAVFNVAASASSNSGATCGNEITISSDGVNCTGGVYDSGSGGCLNAGKSTSGNITMVASKTTRCTVTYTSWCSACTNNNLVSYDYVMVNQVVTFNQPANSALGVPDYSPGAIAQTTNLGATTLPVTYTSGTPAVCTIVGNLVHNMALGTCTVTAGQAGDGVNIAVATVAGGSNLTRSWTVVAPTAQTITVTGAAPASAAYLSTFNVSATASSGLTVAITSGGGCSGSGSGSATITMNSGTAACTVYYNQAGGGLYAAAPQVSSTTTAVPATQTITVSVPAAAAIINVPFTVTASAPGGAVAITSSGVCTGSGSNSASITMNATTGVCTVSYSVAATANYNAATSVSYIGAVDVFPGEGTYSEIRTNWSSLALSSCGASCAKSFGAANHWVRQSTTQATHWVSRDINPNDTWTITQLGSYYTIKSTVQNKCIAAGNGTEAPISLGYLIMEACSGGNKQQWQINPSAAGGAVSGVELQTNGTLGIYDGCAQVPAGQIGGIDEEFYSNRGCGDWRNVLYLGGFAPLVPNHIRYEFNSHTAYTSQPSVVTIKSCTNAFTHGAYGSASSCNLYKGVITITPTAAGAPGLTATGLTGGTVTFQGTTGNSVTVSDPTNGEQVTFGYTLPSTALTDGTLECYDTYNNTQVNCTNAMTFVTMPDHYRFEFDATNGALTCQPMAVTIKACASAAGTCTSLYNSPVTLTPSSTTVPVHASWQGLSASPATTFTGSSSGITLKDQTAGETSGVLSYSSASVTAIGSTALECYNTGASPPAVVSCTNTATFANCTFDAVESGAASGTDLFTKLSGVAFNFDVVGSNATVAVDLVDANTSPVWDCAKGTPTQLLNIGSVSLTGHKVTVPVTYNKAAKQARIRMIDGNNKCWNSFDTFTIRPTEFAVTLPALISGNSFIAGKSTDSYRTGPALTATARYGWDGTSSTGNVPLGYTGTPMANAPQLNDWNSAALNSSLITDNFGTGNGVSASGSVFFDDFGPLNFDRRDTVIDQTFAAVDQASSDCLAGSTSNTADDGSVIPANKGKFGCNVGSSVPSGPTPAKTDRFRPYLYSAVSGVTPACNGFTYVGQNFLGGSLKLTAQSGSLHTMARLTTGAPNLPTFYVTPYDGTTSLSSLNLSITTATNTPLPTAAVSSWTSGEYKVPDLSTYFVVKTGTKLQSYNNFAIGLTVIDPDSVSIGSCTDTTLVLSPATGNILSGGTTCVPKSGGATILRYGVLKLDNAYGSELLPLYVTATARYWTTGTAWAVNTLDSCTTIDPANIAVNGHTASLATNNTALAIPAASVPLVSGAASLKFNIKPASVAPGFIGSADISLNLGASGDTSCNTAHPAFGTPASYTAGASKQWLRGNWCGGIGAYDKDPSARITFGAAKSPFLYQRERY